MVNLRVFRLTGDAVRDRNFQADAPFLEALLVDGVQFLRNLVVQKVGVEVVPGFPQTLHAHEMGIIQIIDHGGSGPAFLAAYKAGCAGGAGRNPVDDVRTDILLQQEVNYAGAENAPHAASFENQSCTHVRTPPVLSPVIHHLYFSTVSAGIACNR